TSVRLPDSSSYWPLQDQRIAARSSTELWGIDTVSLDRDLTDFIHSHRTIRLVVEPPDTPEGYREHARQLEALASVSETQGVETKRPAMAATIRGRATKGDENGRHQRSTADATRDRRPAHAPADDAPRHPLPAGERARHHQVQGPRGARIRRAGRL